MYIAGVKIKSFSGGFISGTIERHVYTYVFVEMFFIYNLYMYETLFKRDLHFNILKITNLQSFGVSIAKYQIKAIVKNVIGATSPEEYEPKNFSVSNSGEREIEVQFTLDPELRSAYGNKLSAIEGFSLDDKHVIKVKYPITEQDEKFYRNNRVLLTDLLKHEYMELNFPRHFAIAVLLLILVKSTASVFG